MELTRAAVAAPIYAEQRTPENPLARLQRAFESCGDGLYRYILVRVGGDRHAADDLVQQVCYEAARKRSIPESVAECEAWMFGIARNRIRKHWRRLSRKGVRLECEDGAIAAEILAAMQQGPLPSDARSRRETAAQLMLAITALPAADQQLVFAYYFDGRSHAEIAAERELTPKSIETRLYRIRARLRSMLGDKKSEVDNE